MKKTISFLLMTLVLCLALTVAGAVVLTGTAEPDPINGQTQKTDAEHAPVFKLPASLKLIDDEAFEGTAVVLVDLPDSVEHIGERAFGNIPTLRFVRIPEQTTYIASTAFAGSNQVTLTAAPNSYARAWAETNRIPFSPFTMMREGNGSIQLSANTTRKNTQTLDEDSTSSSAGIERDSSWRPAEDIQFEQYDSVIANHRAGRAPPMCEG